MEGFMSKRFVVPVIDAQGSTYLGGGLSWGLGWQRR
jgi:hypothetical protein